MAKKKSEKSHLTRHAPYITIVAVVAVIAIVVLILNFMKAPVQVVTEEGEAIVGEAGKLYVPKTATTSEVAACKKELASVQSQLTQCQKDLSTYKCTDACSGTTLEYSLSPQVVDGKTIYTTNVKIGGYSYPFSFDPFYAPEYGKLTFKFWVCPYETLEYSPVKSGNTYTWSLKCGGYSFPATIDMEQQQPKMRLIGWPGTC